MRLVERRRQHAAEAEGHDVCPRTVSMEDMKSRGIRWCRLGDPECWREKRSEHRKQIPPFQPPSGPPLVIKPAHELFGEILLRAQRPQEAAEQFATSLRRHKNRARSLLGA